jgi:hypothetical protein
MALLREQIRLTNDLVRLLAADADAQDRRRQNESDALRSRLDQLQRLAQRKWEETDRNVAALYTAQFLESKGERR